MANKYCDHGLYSGCSFTASTTINSSTLTVTGITSGRLGVGDRITGPNIPTFTFITASAGKGGTGTYTLNNQATATASGQSMTADYGGPALEPTWGVAQEGDGTGTGAATPATVSVDMSSWTFSTASTVSVMGGTAITCTSSATTSAESTTPNAQYSATLTTMIDNLVTAINWHGGTISNRPTGWTQPKIRDSVFARRNGNSLELMTRAGSASWNGLVALAFTNVTGSSSQNWSGGAGGAWCCVSNWGGAWGPSGIAQAGYGLWGSTMPIAGFQDPGDVVYIRSGKEVPLRPNIDHQIPFNSALGTVDNPVRYIFDNSTVWSDGTNPYFKVKVEKEGSQYQIGFLLNGATAVWIIGNEYGDNDYSFQYNFTNCTNGPNFWINTCNKNSRMKNFAAIGDTTAVMGGSYFNVDSDNSSGVMPVFENIFFKSKANAAFIRNSSGYSNGARFRNITFDNTGNANVNPGVISPASASFDAELIGLRCENFIVGSRLFSAAYTGGTPNFRFVNPSYGNVTLRPPSAGSVQIRMDWAHFISSFSQYGNRDFFIDYHRGYIAWNSERMQPVLNALLPDGTTKWSWQIIPTQRTDSINLNCYLETPRIAKINTLSAGARTFTVHFCATDQLTWNKANISLAIEYMAASGKIVYLDTLDPAGSALTADSGVTWNQESGGKVTFVDGGTLYHDKYKLSVSTPSGLDLPADAEVSCWVRVHRPMTNSTQFLFVDPDIEIT